MNLHKQQTISLTLLALLLPVLASAQQMLSLDSCRAMALRSNKQLTIAQEKRQAAQNLQKAARASYLPSINAAGSYVHTSKEISILSNDQKDRLSNIGTNVMGAPLTAIGQAATQNLPQLIQSGLLTPQQGAFLGQIVQGLGEKGAEMVNQMNAFGQEIADAFRTDTRNIFAFGVAATMPVYTGGRLTAVNRIADLSIDMTDQSLENKRQTIIYETDHAYWTVVSLNQKKKLTDKFVATLHKLESDVNKMVDEGVATRADALQISVKVNEAEMMQQTVENGLSLARMYLCQLCSMPLDSNITLEDEGKDDIDTGDVRLTTDKEAAFGNRPELQMLKTAIGISEQNTKVMRSLNLPQVAVVGGYTITNPNVYNSFQNKFSGMWNVGVMLAVPIWNWGEGMYRVRAAKAATNIATLELEEAREKIELQLSMTDHKVTEARNRLAMAKKNIAKAEENLRCADLGYREGIINSTTLLEAQTAWLQAQTQKIDAQIDLRLNILSQRKALGQL